MDDDSDVIELTEEVGSTTQPPVGAASPDDDLGMEMPEFRVPPEDDSSKARTKTEPSDSRSANNEVPSAAIVRRKGSRTSEVSPSGIQAGPAAEYDRQ
ncbi:MAG: hypothetical protein ACNA8W_20030, partial [Bradymonadaceae bacterium]